MLFYTWRWQMDATERLEAILGNHLPQDTKEATFLNVERRLLEKLVRQFSLREEERALVVEALYQFRQTCRHYITLWQDTTHSLPEKCRGLGEAIFHQMEYNLDREGRGCFSQTPFFGSIRFMLHACSKLNVKTEHRMKYLEWLFSFPIVPARSLQELFEHELFLATLPHVYMHMLAGFVRAKLVDERLNHRSICFRYKRFQKELNVGEAHSRWFDARLPGSYGSSQ